MSDDGVAWYLQQAGRIPLLTPSEEISLGNEVQAYMAIRDLPNPTATQKKRIKRGVHSKSKTSKNISSQNYKKIYKSQGR